MFFSGGMFSSPLLCNTNTMVIRSFLPRSLACDVTSANVCKYSELSYCVWLYYAQWEKNIYVKESYVWKRSNQLELYINKRFLILGRMNPDERSNIMFYSRRFNARENSIPQLNIYTRMNSTRSAIAHFSSI